MAAKDFAHNEVVADEEIQDERPVRRTTILVSIVLATMVVMAAFSGGFWMGQKQGVEISSSQNEVRLQDLIKKQKQELENLRLVAKQQHKADDVSMTQVGELMFYNELPRQSVTPSALHQAKDKQTVSPETLKIRDMIHQEMQQQPMLEPNKLGNPEPVVAVPEPNQTMPNQKVQQHYQIQLASFQNNSDAVLFAKKMKQKNVRTRIQQVQLARLGTWYRIVTGDYQDKTQAQQDLVRLKDAIHVTGLVVNQ